MFQKIFILYLCLFYCVKVAESGDYSEVKTVRVNAVAGKVLRQKTVESPYSWVIYPLIWPQVTNQQKNNLTR